jgi:hypothetical protein
MLPAPCGYAFLTQVFAGGTGTYVCSARGPNCFPPPYIFNLNYSGGGAAFSGYSGPPVLITPETPGGVTMSYSGTGTTTSTLPLSLFNFSPRKLRPSADVQHSRGLGLRGRRFAVRAARSAVRGRCRRTAHRIDLASHSDAIHELQNQLSVHIDRINAAIRRPCV